LTHIGVGTTAPDFSLTALDGKTYSLASLLHKGPVVLTFFKISCPVCQFTFPYLQRMAERFAGKNVSVIAVSQDDARSTTKFNEEYGVGFPTLLDAKNYPVSNAFLVGTDGKVKSECMGFDKAGLEKISAELAQHAKLSSAPLFRNDERVPTYKPG
jgi:peroxiredoxin